MCMGSVSWVMSMIIVFIALRHFRMLNVRFTIGELLNCELMLIYGMTMHAYVSTTKIWLML